MLILQIFLIGMAVLGWIFLIVWMLMEKTDSPNRLQNWAFGVGALALLVIPFAIGIASSIEEDSKPFNGYVYKKTYTPAYTSMVLVGKVLVPQSHPPRWNFVLNAPNSSDQRSCDVPEQTWTEVELGQEFHCGGF